MVDFDETRLPGVGVRHDFMTTAGRRIGVITHHTGRKELLVYSLNDPDACSEAVRLEGDESAALTELLGGSRVQASLHDLQQQVEGLAIDWLRIPSGWFADGHSIADTEMRRRTGVSIVAIIRDHKTIPSPVPSHALLSGDTLVVVGTPEGIQSATAVLQRG